MPIICHPVFFLCGGTSREANYTFIWQGKPPEEPQLHGVGFAIKNTLLASVEPSVAGTERILALCMLTESGPANIISVYAPTLCSPPEEKDAFYEALDEMISGIPNLEAIYLLGDSTPEWVQIMEPGLHDSACTEEANQ